MLYYLYELLFEKISFLRIFSYISIRGLIGFILSFLIVLVLGKPFIKFLKGKDVGDDIRDVGPESHFSKKGTPTMGGVLILSSIVISNLIVGNLKNKFTIILLIITILFGTIGFFDDYLKWTAKDKKGLLPKQKILGQLFIAVLIWFFISKFPLIYGDLNFSVVNPFVKNSYFHIGQILYLFLIILLITGTSNAVNITDGLDGLVMGPVMIVSFVLGIIAYSTGHIGWSSYLNIFHIQSSGEIIIFMFSIIGAGLGFLWFNFYPAQIFMGDTGSLALGGIIGAVSIFLKQEFLLPIIGFVFVMEAVSVILQVGSYKIRKKRIFKMAPIHHHFELSGLAETKVTIRFWIVSLLLAIVGLIILKLR